MLDAWRILYETYNINYKLILTVSDSYPVLISQIEKMRIKGLNINNLGSVSHLEVLNIYNKIDYLIYPSLIESFGLPLIEAASLGCNIIAIDKGYVMDIISPSKTFSGNNVNDLVEIIIQIHEGLSLPKTKIIIENHMKQFIELID